MDHRYDPRRQGWDVYGPVPDARAAKVGPKDSRGYELFIEKRPGMDKPHPELGSCIHCHQIGDMETVETLDAGTFQVEQLMQKWPLPENVGISYFPPLTNGRHLLEISEPSHLNSSVVDCHCWHSGPNRSRRHRK